MKSYDFRPTRKTRRDLRKLGIYKGIAKTELARRALAQHCAKVLAGETDPWFKPKACDIS